MACAGDQKIRYHAERCQGGGSLLFGYGTHERSQMQTSHYLEEQHYVTL